MTAFVAPAARVLTEVHIAATSLDSVPPLTVCGLVMELAEVWMPVELRPGDRVCPFCADPGSISEVQGTLL